MTEQVESQLSAMFDGELPAAECELLSRRLDRDENLRARWSRYALIGAAMRSEPVATARRGFATRVSVAIDESEGGSSRTGAVRRKRKLWNAALAASMVAAVAGGSITMLRYSDSSSGAVSIQARSAQVPQFTMPTAAVQTALVAAAPTASVVPTAARIGNSNGEPISYVTPANRAGSGIGLRTELADYIVAHSEYSTPLIRRSLLSALVSEDGADGPAANVNPVEVGAINAAVAASSSSR